MRRLAAIALALSLPLLVAPDPEIAGGVAGRSRPFVGARPAASAVESPAQITQVPRIVRGIYVTMWTAASVRMSRLLALLDRTELNAVVLDVKDSQGNLAWEVVPHFDDLVARLHARGVYVIGRLAQFQDSRFAHQRPDLALARSDGRLWRDRLGYAWLDPASREVWDRNFALAREAVRRGVDEINFDYVRFPSDGALRGIVYPIWRSSTPRVAVIRAFMAAARRALGAAAPLSVDLFAFAALRDDMGVGQRLRDAAEFFDYVCLMAYPSHYSRGNFGFANPAARPYEVVAATLDRALAKVSRRAQLRPWLQDFDLGARYDAGMVRAQITAALERGVSGWLLWNPGNVYTEGALRPEDTSRR